LVQTEGEVETLSVVVATSILDGEGIASEPLDWILLRIVLGDSQRLEFLWEEQIAKSTREGGEAIVLVCRGGFLASNFFNSAAGVVVWTPWAHYLGGYQDQLLGGPLGLSGLCHTAPDGVRRKDYGGEVLG
jgi:hypothetical protein